MSDDTMTGQLTLERMRADVAEILHEPLEEVGLDDNLMDLGLDSMRAMTLVTMWSDTGILYEFGDFASAEPTLKGWWHVVSRRQAEPSGEG